MISVIVKTLNAAATLGACLDNLMVQNASGEAIETIVVDGGSSDKTIEIAKAAGAGIIQYDGRNSAKARNEALAIAQGELICFTNGDCIPGEDWIDDITRPFSNPEIIGCKGSYETSQENVIARFVQLEYEEKYDRLKSRQTIDFVDGYSAAYRRVTLEANNGFDERFPHSEDQELSYRLASRGYKMVFIPGASVRHVHITEFGSYCISKFQTAYWKSQIVRKFPDRGYRDSYTPQIIKIQMLLIAGILLSLGLLFATLKVVIATLILIFCFLLTTLPFMLRTWKREPVIALLSPVFFGGRATALGFGYSLGAVRFATKKDRDRNTISGLNYLVKRGLDITGGTLGLCLLLFLYPIIGLSIRRNSPGPVIFSQERAGRGGKTFTIYKFRSMIVDTGDKIDEPKLPATPNQKLQHDPRITAVGKFLRRWSLDELPQFWNVLLGNMSLVGPRPEQTSIVAVYSDRQRRRLAVKPGITGPMQISGRADLSLDERLALEVEYIKEYSLKRDFLILARTLPAVIQGQGAR